MGTDVHAVWQAKRGEQWVDIASEWDQGRHYLLFSWLAGVLNGCGFAGHATYDPVTPIAPPRGLPEDFEGGEDHPTTLEAIHARRREWLDEEERAHPVMWMGDHSYSWLTADEILAAKRPTTVHRHGVVPIAFYRAWDGVTPPPNSWSGWVSGISVAEKPDDITEATTHVCIEWNEADGLDYFVDEVRRLAAQHGEVRLVFGFDS